MLAKTRLKEGRKEAYCISLDLRGDRHGVAA
jgi:hypothetical protein